MFLDIRHNQTCLPFIRGMCCGLLTFFFESLFSWGRSVQRHPYTSNYTLGETWCIFVQLVFVFPVTEPMVRKEYTAAHRRPRRRGGKGKTKTFKRALPAPGLQTNVYDHGPTSGDRASAGFFTRVHILDRPQHRETLQGSEPVKTL